MGWRIKEQINGGMENKRTKWVVKWKITKWVMVLETVCGGMENKYKVRGGMERGWGKLKYRMGSGTEN